MRDGSSYTRWTRVRIGLCGLVILALMALVVRRGYTLQAVEGQRLKEMAEQQYLKQIELPAQRGTILDRHGTPLAVSVDVDSIHANPRVVGRQAAAVARQLSPILGLPPSLLQRRLTSRRFFAWIKRRVSPREAKQVAALKIPGIYLAKEPRRYYPNQELGSTVVGFSGMEGRGLEGIELSQDHWLKGSPIRVSGLRDALGHSVYSEGVVKDPSRGHTVELTLDKFVQYEVEQALAEAVKGVKPREGWVGAMVLDPSTGDILAMANAPAFNPNRYDKVKPERWRNRLITDAFEPGSTMKIFSIGAALEAGVVRPEEVFDCEDGRWRVGHYTIHDSHPYSKLDVWGILQKSSNICSAKIAFRLGKKGLHEYLLRFGFGRATGLPLRGERHGVLRSPGRWSDVGLANIAFGQGMTVTVIQLVRALTAVANDGFMVEPRMVLRIRDPHGAVTLEPPTLGRRVLRPDVARLVRRMLVKVTEEGGTATRAALDRYTVAGKTGTAQKVDPVTRTYSKDRWVSSFVGMAPASKPRLIIAVLINEPDGEKHYGGEVAAPVFQRIADRVLPYLGVTPDKTPSPKPVGQAVTAAVESEASEGYIDQDEDPAPPLPGEGHEPVGADAILLPDFTGQSMVEVLAEAKKLGLTVQLEGSGRAVAQSPGPGPAHPRVICQVSFRPPG